MGILVYFLVPETKGRTLERMDEVFGTAYGDLHELELSAFGRDLELGPGKEGMRKEANLEREGEELTMKAADTSDSPLPQ